MQKYSEEHAFLPAALEVQEAPPSPLGRGLIWAIVALFVCALVWAAWAEVDIVAVARGKIVPSGRVKVIQPLTTSVVKAIHVRDGQAVSVGDVLIEFDPTVAQADVDRYQTELRAVEGELTRNNALLVAAGDDKSAEPPTNSLITNSLQRDLLAESFRAYQADRMGLEQAIERARADQRGAQMQVAKFEATLPLITERSGALKKLVSQNLVARTQYLELEQQRIAVQQDLETQKEASRSAKAQIASYEAELHSLQADFRTKIMTRVDELERQRASLAQEVIKVERVRDNTMLTAPVDGIVQQLDVHTVGGVVTPAQPLLVIVPRDAQLEVEAYVENKDIGFVEARQQAEVKIDSFPFTRYGTVPGRITSLSDDAVNIKDVGMVYAATVALAKTVMDVEGKSVNLSPGMAVTVEVKTGNRRLLEFIASPLMAYSMESARER